MILLIIDVQIGFITHSSKHIVAPIEAIQHRFEKVIATKFYNPDPSPFREILDYHKLPQGHSDTKLAFNLRTDAEIIERPAYTCVRSELIERLEHHQTKEIYICGVATEACVLKTVLDLFELNVRCWLITDLCASDQDAHYHDMAIKLIGKLINQKHLIRSDQIK